MPAHTAAWNNLSPVGSDLASSIDDFMRAMKVDVDERMSLQHYWADAIAEGNNQDGTHKEITLTPATTNTPLFKTNANQSLTGSNASSAIDLGITWNTTGTPTALKTNVTDTASNAAALLLDLQVGGVSQFKVSKAGAVTVAGALTVAGAVSTGALTASSLVTPTVANNTFYKANNTAGPLDILGINSVNNIIVGNQDSSGVGQTQFRSGLGFHWNINGTVVWNITSSGHIQPNATNTYDIGDATHAVRSVYARDLFLGLGNIYDLSGNSRYTLNSSVGTPPAFAVTGGTWGTGATPGGLVSVGRNSSGTGAPGCIGLITRGGTQYYLWVDNSGILRLSTSQPTVTSSDVTGTVVGSQA